MRKIFFAVLAATALFAGCAKEESAPVQKEIKVNFTVAEKSDFGADTKAIKAGWEVGDQILLVFQGNDATYKGDWLGWANNNNTITLTKTAGGWESTPKNLDLEDLQSGKNYMAIHHMGNITISSEYIDASYRAYLTGYKGGEIMSCMAQYTVNGEALDLGTIELARDVDLFQISVKDLTGDNWKMSICIDKAGSRTGLNIIHMRSDKTFIFDGGVGQYGVYDNATGVEYGGDVVFDFKKLAMDSETLVFKLTNGTDTYYYTKTGVTSTTLKGGKAYYLPAITDLRWETE